MLPLSTKCSLKSSKLRPILNRGEREWLMRVREREGNWKSPFPKFGNGKGIEKAHSRNSGTGRELKKPIPKIREREGNWKSPFTKFGNGKAIKKYIPKFWEWEGNEKIPFPKFGNGKGMKKIHSQNSGTGREWKNPFPKFGKGNQRPPFLGMTGNGNSRSPLEQIWMIPFLLRVGPMFVYVLPKISFISRTTPFAILGRLLKVIEHIIVIGWRVCIQCIVQCLSLQHRSEWRNTVVVLATIKEETDKAQSIRLFASGRHLAPLVDIVRFTDVPTLSNW